MGAACCNGEDEVFQKKNQALRPSSNEDSPRFKAWLSSDQNNAAAPQNNPVDSVDVTSSHTVKNKHRRRRTSDIYIRDGGSTPRSKESSRQLRERMLAANAKDVFERYDADNSGLLDSKELEKLITHCMEQLSYDSEQRFELMQDFSVGSRTYCMSALKMISDDGKVGLQRFKEWLQEEDNFLFFPLPKFKVMLWAFDLFYEFDIDGDGMITEQEFDSTMRRLHEEVASTITSSSSAFTQILSELNFSDYDCIEADKLLSTKELVSVMLSKWERLHDALFTETDDFFGAASMSSAKLGEGRSCLDN